MTSDPSKPYSFQVMAKPCGPICNLACDYCYYLDKILLYPDRPASTLRMSDDLLEEYIRSFISEQQHHEVTFSWQGGEPTLSGLDFFRKAFALQRKHCQGKTILNTLQTNGTLLTPEWAEFLSDHNVLVGISIDGPEDLHDAYRVTRGSRPSWQKVMRGIELLKKNKVEFNTLTVVNDLNAKYPVKVYEFLKSIGSSFHQYIPIVKLTDEQGATCLATDSDNSKLHPASVSGKEYGHFMSAIFDEWVQRDVGKVFVQLFDVTLANWLGVNPSLCVFSDSCGAALSMEHNGDVYSCDHFTFPEYKLGNIRETGFAKMLHSSKQMHFAMNKSQAVPAQCRQCPYFFACKGGCPKDRIIELSGEHYRLNHLCKGYKRFFSHVSPYMDFMANELRHQRPAHSVMKFAAKN